MMNIIKVVENPDPTPTKAFPDKPAKPVDGIPLWETERAADGGIYVRLANGSAVSLKSLEDICQCLSEKMRSDLRAPAARRDERDYCEHRRRMCLNVPAFQKQAAI